MDASLIRLHFHDCFAQVGGPSWTVKLGRRDSTTASHTLAETDLPGPFDPLDRIIPGFANKGPSARDMIALSAMEQTSMLDLLALEDVNVLEKTKIET
ncbi:hypothetical protein FXO38_04611 [Capsicum annuum]|nr:hypothetical protein FXO37_21477 [Capsicum annuum]KAF3675766.1 hypothetical protein FXO38_04611 [Capsicum annuum]